MQLVLVCQPLAFHERLTVRAFLPGLRGHFVAADVDILAGKHVKYLRQNIIQKRESFFLGGVVNAVENPARERNGKRPAGATVLRIRRQRRRCVTGHFNFRNDGDVPRRRIGEHLPDVIRRVKPAVPAIRAVGGRGFWVQTESNTRPPGADLRQERIFIDFDAPALVIG